MRISDKPWSRFSESDYSLEQWYEACLIKPPKSEYTAKSQAKLPVLEPDGTLNKNGVHAAAAALAGARGGIKASPQEKKKAARALIRLYRQLEEEPPETIKRMSE
ncbi:MAG: hypothetical protein QXS68_05820 [Candidatus Methanomethylicaceae archaeon]